MSARETLASRVRGTGLGARGQPGGVHRRARRHRGVGDHRTVFHFSDTWQLVINTGTTIVTFLMVFLIQNTQNRDAKAIHLKLDELIRAVKGARNTLVDLENCTDEELAELQEEFERLHRRLAAHDQRVRKPVPPTPDTETSDPDTRAA